MNKKILILACTALVAAMLVGCGAKNEKNNEQVKSEGAVVVQQNEAGDTSERDVSIKEQANDNSINIKNPISGELTEAVAGVGVEKGEYVADVEENTSPVPTAAPSPAVTPSPTETPDPTVTPTPGANTKPALPNGLNIRDITYEMYMNMTGEEQALVIAQFGSVDDFMVWFNAIKAIYEAENPNIEIGGDGTVDLSK